ncbi:germin-like protein 9-3 [Populus alba]|uniref:germin-like protein 9-3 n=1 Tax=Populus alba TaxID=43335 RepID=UPI0015889803|nr:germin-like protein 9-3 [Populus alba]
MGFVLVSVLIFACFQIAVSGDADIISDFIVPPNVTKVDGRLFTCTALRSLVGAKPPTSFTASKVSMPEFPALNGQSVSYAFLQYPAGTLNPPRTHPPSAELLFLVDGCLEVGFVGTANKLFTQTLEAGDMFVFPKGRVHYQYNNDPKNLAGTVSIPSTLFTTGVDSGILAEAFETDVATIEKIKAGFA